MIGVIGLGAIGGGIAASLAASGLEVRGFDTSPEARERATAAGVHAALSAKEVFGTCDITILSLPSFEAIRTTYDTLTQSAQRPGAIVVEASTVSAEMARELGDITVSTGRQQVEMSVIGTGREAASATLFFLLGGQEDAAQELAPVLTAAGRGHIYLGPLGAASTAKVLNNGIGLATILAMGEAIAAAAEAGINPDAFVKAVIEGNGAGASVVFTRHAHKASSAEPEPPTPLNYKDSVALGQVIASAAPAYPSLRLTSTRVGELIGNGESGLTWTTTQTAREKARALRSG